MAMGTSLRAPSFRASQSLFLIKHGKQCGFSSRGSISPPLRSNLFSRLRAVAESRQLWKSSEVNFPPQKPVVSIERPHAASVHHVGAHVEDDGSGSRVWGLPPVQYDVGRAVAEQPQLWQSLEVNFPAQEHVSIERSDVESDHHVGAHVGVDGSGSGMWGLPPVQHDVGVTLMVLVGGWAWVRLFDFLTKRNYLGQKLSRKLVHITSGLLFAACWPFYSSFPWAQFLAALVPVSNGIRLLVYGLGFLKDEGLVKSVSREGDPRELLRGPLYYVVVLVFSTVLFWRDSPVGVMALAMMCGGDGIADIVGRRFGSTKLPYNPGKSWAGSIAMFLFGFLVSYGCLWYFSHMGFYQLDTKGTLLRVAVVSLAATIVESLPISTKLDDNVTVPLTTVLVGLLLFPPGAHIFGLPNLM